MRCQHGGGSVSAVAVAYQCAWASWVVRQTIESETPMTPVIEAEGLTKRFGDTQALAGVDIAADRGQVLALLGPNGAGKTTIVRVLSTLLRPDSGQARICGYDVLADAVQRRGDPRDSDHDQLYHQGGLVPTGTQGMRTRWEGRAEVGPLVVAGFLS